MSGASRALSLAMLVVSLALAWSAFRTVMAYSSMREAQEFVVATQSRGGSFDFERWQGALASARRAQSWWSSNAEVGEWFARVALLGVSSVRLPAVEIDALRKDAIAQLRAAAADRPHWPYAWATLALAKAGAGEFDAELDAAVANAARHGPHEPRITRQLAEVYLAVPRERAARSPELRAAYAVMLREAASTWIDRADRRARAQYECAQAGLPAAALERCRALRWIE